MTGVTNLDESSDRSSWKYCMSVNPANPASETVSKEMQTAARIFGLQLPCMRLEEHRSANAGSKLKPLITQEGTAWKASLPAILGKNPPCGLGRNPEGLPVVLA
jgi:hypothetical protein